MAPNKNANIQIKGGEVTIPNQAAYYASFPPLIPPVPATAPITPPISVGTLQAFPNSCLDFVTFLSPVYTIAPPPGLTNTIDWTTYVGTCADSLPCPQSHTSGTIAQIIGLPLVTNSFPITGFGDTYLSLLEQYGPLNGTLSPPGPYPSLNTLVDIDFATGDFTGQGEVTTWTGALTGYSITNINYYDVLGAYSSFATVSEGTLMNQLEYMNIPNVVCNDVAMSALTKQEVLMGVVEAPEIQSEVFIERGKQSVFERIQRFGEITTIGGLLTYGYGFNNIKEEITNG